MTLPPGAAEAASQVPAHVQLLALAAGKWVSQPLYAVAKLGVADLLVNGPQPVESLAERTGTLADPLRRTLRAVAMFGVLTEGSDGRFGLTPLGDHLRTGVPQSVRAFTILMGEQPMWRSFGWIMHCLQTGQPAFAAANGSDLSAALDLDPALGQTYQSAWAALTDELAEESLAALELHRFASVADLGGGQGNLLAAMLASQPRLSGVLLDRPAVVAQLTPALREPQIRSRFTVLPGALPDDIPSGIDCYVLKNTLHCFDDPFATEVLEGVRKAIGSRNEARLLVIETVVPEGDRFDWSKLIDMEVMVNNGGRERTADQWRRLLSAGGFELERIADLTPPQHLLEGRAVGVS